MQEGDVSETCAEVSNLKGILNYKPTTTVHIGISRFITWYKAFYKPGKQNLEPVSTTIDML
jgi:UDP-glucuronate 4-epimerase